jgi:acetoin utilization deacetylase AcuC-like enzyme
MTSPVGFLMHEAAPLHDAGWGHPEHQGRLRALASAVAKDLLALHGHVEMIEPPMATLEALLRVHPEAYLGAIRTRSEEAEARGESLPFAPDTVVSGATWDAVLGSAGGAILAAERVADGAFSSAFVATRPPGHHAYATEAMGFCLVNHVAVVARHLQATGRAERVAIVDWDVHHGNGTQAIFEDDPTVFFLSLHQAPPFYPGSGYAHEVGTGAGEGMTRNVPLPPGTDGRTFAAALEAALTEAASVFQPDVVLISAGYDALAADPLGGMNLEPNDYYTLTKMVLAWAEAQAHGRVVALLEGGYAPIPTGAAVVATLRALAGLPAPTSIPHL